MKQTKKLLSVILALVMLMTSVSVCFTCFGASTYDDYIALLGDALTGDVLGKVIKNFNPEVNYGRDEERNIINNTGKDANNKDSVFNVNSVVLDTYEQYTKFLKVFDYLKNAIDLSSEISSYKTPNSSKDSGSKRYCTNFLLIKSNCIAPALESYLTPSVYSDYHIASFLDVIFNQDFNAVGSNGTMYYHENSGSCIHADGDQSKVLDRYYTITEIKTKDVKGYMNAIGDYSNIPYNGESGEAALGAKFTLQMSRENYQTGMVFKSNHYHYAVNTNNSNGSVASISTSTYNALIDTDYFDNYILACENVKQFFGKSFTDLLGEIAENRLTTEIYNAFKAAYDEKPMYAYPEDDNTYELTLTDSLRNSLVTKYNGQDTEFYKNAESALSAKDLIDAANEWNRFKEDYAVHGVFNWGSEDFTLEDLNAVYEGTDEEIGFDVLYSALSNASGQAKDYLVDNGYIVIEELEAYNKGITDNIKAFTLYNSIQAIRDIYEAYGDDCSNMSETEQQAAYTQVKAFMDSLENYSDEVFNAITSEEEIAELTVFEANIMCAMDPVVSFFANIVYNPLLKTKTKYIKGYIEKIPENLQPLRDFYLNLQDELGETAADAALGYLYNKSLTLVDELYQFLADRFSAEVGEAYRTYYDVLDAPTEVVLENFVTLYKAFNPLEIDLYKYLEDNGKLDLVSASTMAKYNSVLADIYDKYVEFSKTFGFNTYNQNHIDENGSYGSREYYEGKDRIKNSNTPYEIKATTIEDTITKIDTILRSERFGNLIGQKDYKGLAPIIGNLLKKVVYTDDFLNTIIKLLYPLVAGEFVKVWAGLPSFITIPNVDTGIAGIKVDAEAKLKLDTVEEATSKVGLPIFPAYLADTLPEEYADVAAVLRTATTKSSYDQANDLVTTAWTDEAIMKDGKLNLNWGITDKESFIKAASAALKGLEPLLFALLLNIPFEPAKDGEGNEIGANIGTGSGNVDKDFPIIGHIKLKLTIDPISLKLTASANEGYNNMIAPIIEALGITAPNGNNFSTTADFIEKGLVEPITEFITKLGNAPIDTLASILPNVCYALSANMIPSLLKMLKTDINYTADAHYDAQVTSGDLKGAMKSDEPIEINVGKMISFDSIEINGWPLDLTDLNGLIGALGINLPKIDTLLVATLGKLETEAETKRTAWIYGDVEGNENNKQMIRDVVNSKERFTIEADKADVVYYVLSYVLDLVQNEEAMTALLSKFMGEDAIASVMNIINNTLNINSSKDTIASVLELLNAVTYEQKNFVWPKYVESSEEPTEGENASDEDATSVLYTKYWTKEKATYVADNLVDFVEKTAALIGYNISDLVTNLISGLLTRDNVVAIVNALNKILSENGTVKTVVNILNIAVNVEGVDIKAIINELLTYEVPEFENGDKKAFVDAIVNYILPLVPILRLFVINSRIVDQYVQVYGYNGYDSAIIPLLEAIGCENIKTYEQFKALDNGNGEGMIRAIIDPIVDLVERISDDPINKIVEILPNLIYFIDFGGLQQTINNILEPVYVVLDVIRPIKNVDLTIDLNLNEIVTDLLAGANMKSLCYDDLANAVKSLGTVKPYKSVNGSNAVKLEVEDTLTPDFITLVLYIVLDVVMYSDNVDVVIDKITSNENLTEKQAKDIEDVIRALLKLESHDQVLFVLFYIFFGVNEGYETMDDVANLVNDKMTAIIKKVSGMSPEKFGDFVVFGTSFIQFIAGSIEEATSGSSEKTQNFFQKIADFFNRIFEYIRNLFKFGK